MKDNVSRVLSSAAEEEIETENKSRKRNKEDEKDSIVVTPARKSARLAKPNWWKFLPFANMEKTTMPPSFFLILLEVITLMHLSTCTLAYWYQFYKKKWKENVCCCYRRYNADFLLSLYVGLQEFIYPSRRLHFSCENGFSFYICGMGITLLIFIKVFRVLFIY